MIRAFTGLLNDVTNVSISHDDKFLAATSYKAFYIENN